MYRQYAFIVGTYVVALCSLLAGFSAAQSGGWLAPFFIVSGVVAPILIAVGGAKLGRDWLGIEPPK